MARKQIATFLAPNKGLSIVGNHAYSYSGVVGITDSETTMNEFTTGNYYLKGTIQISYLELTSIDINYRIYLNGLVVQGYLAYETAGASEPDNLIPLIIPPNTSCKIAGTAANGSPDHCATFVGRVYDA